MKRSWEYREKDSPSSGLADRLKKLLSSLPGAKYLLLVALAGLALLLLPAGESGREPETAAALSAPDFDLAAQETRLEGLLSSVEGAGEVEVLLSLKTGPSRELARSGEEALVISAGSGTEEAVDARYVYPEYMGAVVSCAGAGDARVVLAVKEAVAAFTGLGSGRITVLKMR